MLAGSWLTTVTTSLVPDQPTRRWAASTVRSHTAWDARVTRATTCPAEGARASAPGRVTPHRDHEGLDRSHLR